MREVHSVLSLMNAYRHAEDDALSIGLLSSKKTKASVAAAHRKNSSSHAAGFWHTAASTYGFLVAAQEDANDRRNKGLDPREEAASKASIDLETNAFTSHDWGPRRTLREMTKEAKASLDDVVEKAIDEYTGDTTARLLGFFSVGDGRFSRIPLVQI